MAYKGILVEKIYKISQDKKKNPADPVNPV